MCTPGSLVCGFGDDCRGVGEVRIIGPCVSWGYGFSGGVQWILRYLLWKGIRDTNYMVRTLESAVDSP